MTEPLSEDPQQNPFQQLNKLSDLVAQFFGEESPLKNKSALGERDYEDRPQQRQMALKIAESLENARHLCVEAPTGIGKSFAYLIPAIFLAKATNKPVVISTHTIALQEQLINKDIPMLQKVLEVPFSASLAKGRANYVCMHRLQNCEMYAQDFLPSMDLEDDVQRISKWVKTTRDGSRSDLSFNPSAACWTSVNSEPGICKMEKENHPQCFFARARRKLYTSDIIVANHALLCADFAMRKESDGAQSVLPEYVGLVIDEAHTFEETAAVHLGIRVNSFSINLLLNRLFNTRSQRGLLARADTLDARNALIDARDQTDRFFQHLRTWLEQQEKNPLPHTHAGHIPNVIALAWEPLINELKVISKNPDFDDDYAAEIKMLLGRLREIRDSMEIFLQMQIKDCVYWFERSGRDQRIVSMNVVPIDISKLLRNTVFNKHFTVIMTSATLAVSNSLDYFIEHMGCDDAETLILDSPFNFKEQLTLHVPYSKMPDPRKTDDFIEACTKQVRRYLDMSDGRAFVLFTNYSYMNQVADLMLDYFDERGYRLLVQGREHQRSKMLDIFRKDIQSVIFGTDSFWMGVDVPGEALSNVIIVRLPFMVPTHPLTAAIADRLEEDGKSSFRHYFLPEAVLKFRQGVGRLIRRKNDKGIIVVLDPRIIKNAYGKMFLDSIPDSKQFIE